MIESQIYYLELLHAAQCMNFKELHLNLNNGNSLLNGTASYTVLLLTKLLVTSRGT